MEITIEFGNRSADQDGKRGEKNRPAAARNLMPPFSGQRVYGTDPRRQGFVAGEILRKRENLSSHRAAPLTAPVRFRKTRCTSGKGGKCKAAGSRLAPALLSGQNAASKVPGSAPATPHGKNQNYRLTRGGLLMEAVTRGSGPANRKQPWPKDHFVRRRYHAAADSPDSGYFLPADTWPRPSRASFPWKCALSTRFAGSAFSPRCGAGPL